METMLSYLSSIIPLRQTKKKTVYVSNVCPFTGNVSKRRPLRYNTKLKVVKCFCCGCSAKELNWLKLRIEKPMEAEIKILRSSFHIFFPEKSEEEIKMYIEYRIKDMKEKANAFDEGIAKTDDEDLNLPF